MPASPSMKVIPLRVEAVLRKAGSYDINPSWRRSVARIVPSEIGISTSFPVRLSLIVSVSSATPPPYFRSPVCSSAGAEPLEKYDSKRRCAHGVPFTEGRTAGAARGPAQRRDAADRSAAEDGAGGASRPASRGIRDSPRGDEGTPEARQGGAQRDRRRHPDRGLHGDEGPHHRGLGDDPDGGRPERQGRGPDR